MTPKEKAEELVDRFTFNCRECDNAKQCALIAVDEIMKSIDPFGQFLGKDYWEEVKQELEKL